MKAYNWWSSTFTVITATVIRTGILFNVKKKNSSNRTYTGHEIPHLKILVLYSIKMTTKQAQQPIKIILDTLVPNSSD